MKSILFVINTMGVGGGAKAILQLLKQLDFNKYEVSKIGFSDVRNKIRSPWTLRKENFLELIPWIPDHIPAKTRASDTFYSYAAPA